MTTPYTVHTPEYTAWAKRGEEVGFGKDEFTKLVDKLIYLVEKGDIDWKVYDDAREKIKETFDFDHCECD